MNFVETVLLLAIGFVIGYFFKTLLNSKKNSISGELMVLSDEENQPYIFAKMNDDPMSFLNGEEIILKVHKMK